MSVALSSHEAIRKWSVAFTTRVGQSSAENCESTTSLQLSDTWRTPPPTDRNNTLSSLASARIRVGGVEGNGRHAKSRVASTMRAAMCSRNHLDVSVWRQCSRPSVECARELAVSRERFRCRASTPPCLVGAHHDTSSISRLCPRVARRSQQRTQDPNTRDYHGKHVTRDQQALRIWPTITRLSRGRMCQPD